jgi:beta-lactamase regulating signal transducer with metallopeptidase domain/protocatechuate 3,4-dioxygenase beta subunit
MNALELAFGLPWMARLGWTLVHFLWQGTVIAAAYAMADGLGGRLLSARARYALACAALTTMAMAPPVTFLASGNLIAATPAFPIAGGPSWELALPLLVVIWAAGVALFSARLIGGWRVVARLRRVAVSAPPAEWREALDALMARMRVAAPVRLLASALASTPTVVGWLRPAILVPVEALTGMPAEHVRALLAHELAHILRRDYLVNMLQSVAEAVLFYHPAVWWVSGRIRAERESCCDDLAVDATGDVLAYASALANLDSSRRARLRLAATADGGSLVSRIRRLLGHTEPLSHTLPHPAAAWTLTVFWLAGVGAVMAYGAHSPAEAGVRMARRAFVPPIAVAASTPLRLPTPPGIRFATAVSLTSALLFDPFFAPLPQTPPPDDPKQLATVSGAVLSTSGTPVAGASAVLNPLRTARSPGSGPQPKRQVAVTDLTGRFTLENVAPGTYQFWVSHPVYLNPTNLNPRTEAFGPLPPSRLTLTAGQHVEDIAVRLIEPATITGRTVDEDGDPVARADVQLIRRVYSQGRRRLEVVGSGVSNDSGEFGIGGVAPGRYILKADKGLLWVPVPASMGYFGSRPPRSNDIPRAPIPAAKPGTKIYNPASTYYGGSKHRCGRHPHRHRPRPKHSPRRHQNGEPADRPRPRQGDGRPWPAGRRARGADERRRRHVGLLERRRRHQERRILRSADSVRQPGHARGQEQANGHPGLDAYYRRPGGRAGLDLECVGRANERHGALRRRGDAAQREQRPGTGLPRLHRHARIRQLLTAHQ